MSVAVWPLPCRSCGSDIKQQTEWNTDASNFRQKCHVCGNQGDWEPYRPVKVGYTYDALARAAPNRRRLLEKARAELVLARQLSLAYVPLRERIDGMVEEVDECLRSLR